MTINLSPIYSTGYKKRPEHVAEMRTQPGLLVYLVISAENKLDSTWSSGQGNNK